MLYKEKLGFIFDDMQPHNGKRPIDVRKDSPLKAFYLSKDDGRTWLGLTHENMSWEEPMSDWEYVCDLVAGQSYFRQKHSKMVAADFTNDLF